MVDNVASNSTVTGDVPLYGLGPLQVSTAPVCVEYRVAQTSDFNEVESSGIAYTSSDIDYTIKVEAKNLTPWTRYYYQWVSPAFRNLVQTSEILTFYGQIQHLR